MKKPTKKARSKATAKPNEGGRVRIWLVYNPNGAAPRREHYSEKSATDEAKRLACANIGQQFLVLKTVSAFFAPKPEPVAMPLVAYVAPAPVSDDDIPF